MLSNSVMNANFLVRFFIFSGGGLGNGVWRGQIILHIKNVKPAFEAIFGFEKIQLWEYNTEFH